MKKSKKNIFSCFCIFAIGIIIGFLFLYMHINISTSDMNFDIDVYESQNKVLYIFFNNLCVSVLMICGCGVITIPLLLYQGLQFGALLGVWCSSGLNWLSGVMLFLPHGILEIPALILTASLGNELFFVGKKYFINNENTLKSYFQCNKTKMILIISLLLFAAFIECFITPRLYGRFFNV